MERIEADLLVPGRGEPIRDGVVVWDGPTITYAGPAAGAPPAGRASSTRAVAVLPSLWDCHGHLIGTRTLDPGRLPLEALALRAVRCAGDLRAALDAGVTSVREVGGLGVHLARAVEEGTVEGSGRLCGWGGPQRHWRARGPAFAAAAVDGRVR